MHTTMPLRYCALYRVAGYDFGNVGVGALGGVSQVGFYGPPRTIAHTASYHY